MKLYYAPKTRAARPRWLLEEVGVPYDLVRLDMKKGEHRSPEYQRIHPHGAVPALVDGDLHIFESAAICMYLADKFPEHQLAPEVGSHDRGRYYQWMIYSMATLEPPVVQFAGATFGPEDKRSPTAADAARAKVSDALRVVDAALDGKSWLVGDRFTAADVLVGSIVVWAASMKLTAGHANVEAYVERCKARPALARARAD